MSAREQGRYVLLFLMGVIFLVMVVICIVKWNDHKVGETQSTREAIQSTLNGLPPKNVRGFCDMSTNTLTEVVPNGVF